MEGPAPSASRSAKWARAVSAALVLTLGIFGPAAAECPAVPEPQIPKAFTPLNIDAVKALLRTYHTYVYMTDIARAFAVARAYVERRVGEVEKPAVVLDIDETSLTNWQNLDLNDFGFIPNGTCTEEKGFSCGFTAWVGKGTAPAIEPALAFYNAVQGKGAAMFFITGRRDSQRDITVKNLTDVGFRNWQKLVTRPDGDKNPSLVPFKSGERAKIAAENYRIIATIGDQDSDLAGGFAECGFKIPNPFYFIQ
jgi:hypothetical protein